MSLFKNEYAETHVGDLCVYKDRIQAGNIIFITTDNFKKYIPTEWIKSKIDAILDSYPDGNDETEILCKLLYEWEKENDSK